GLQARTQCRGRQAVHPDAAGRNPQLRPVDRQAAARRLQHQAVRPAAGNCWLIALPMAPGHRQYPAVIRPSFARLEGLSVFLAAGTVTAELTFARTRIQPPRLRSDLINRPGLDASLQRALAEQRLTLIV